MGQIKWYKRDPEAALEGMRKLTLEQRGAYNTVLDLIYMRDGNLPDDDRFIAGWLDVDVRVWKRLKDSLIAAGKLRIEGGIVRNDKADAVVDEALRRVASSRNAGQQSGLARGKKSEPEKPQNNDLGGTGVPTDAATDVQQSKIERDIPNGISPLSSPKPKSAAGKMPDDWLPVLTPAAQRIVDGWPPGKFDRELARFRDHAADKGRMSKDWQAAFRTWLNKADEWNTGNGTGNRNADHDEPRNPYVRAALEREAERSRSR